MHKRNMILACQNIVKVHCDLRPCVKSRKSLPQMGRLLASGSGVPFCASSVLLPSIVEATAIVRVWRAAEASVIDWRVRRPNCDRSRLHGLADGVATRPAAYDLRNLPMYMRPIGINQADIALSAAGWASHSHKSVIPIVSVMDSGRGTGETGTSRNVVG